MAEIWGAAIAVGGAVVSGMAASKKAKEDRKNAKEDSKEMTKDDALYSAILSQFEAEQEDRFNQLQRQRKQRGLDQFRQFSTTGQFAPQYADTSRIEVGEKPNINNIIDSVIPQEEEAGQRAKRKKSTLEKIDPLGTKILKGLF